MSDPKLDLQIEGAPSKTLQAEVREFYKKSEEYCQVLSAEREEFFQRYLGLIDRYASKCQKVLDAGCGTGLSTHLLSQKKEKVVGIDLSPLFLQKGRQKLGRPDLPLVAGDLLSLPFKSNSFDLVVMYLVIEVLPDAEQALREMMRVLRPGGTFIIYNANLLSPLWPWRDFWRMLFGGASRPVWCDRKRSALRLFWKNFCLSIQKTFEKKPHFLYRTPDMKYDKVVGHGRESFYLACPTDITLFLKQHGFRILYRASHTLIDKLIPAFSYTVEIAAVK